MSFSCNIWMEKSHVAGWKPFLQDYTGANVTPEIFLKVLQGEDPGVGSRKVIASGPNDRIFFYFADHGANSWNESWFHDFASFDKIEPSFRPCGFP